MVRRIWSVFGRLNTVLEGIWSPRVRLKLETQKLTMFVEKDHFLVERAVVTSIYDI